jgi:hypothetical protein
MQCALVQYQCLPLGSFGSQVAATGTFSSICTVRYSKNTTNYCVLSYRLYACEHCVNDLCIVCALLLQMAQ